MKWFTFLPISILSIGLLLGISPFAEAGTVYSSASWLSTGLVEGDTGPCVGDVGDAGPAWTQLGFDDAAWVGAFPPVPVTYYPPGVDNTQLMWAQGDPLQGFFRYALNLGSKPAFANTRLWADDNLEFYVNGVLVDYDRSGGAGDYPSGSEFAFRELDIAEYLVAGTNILAIRGWDGTYCNVAPSGGKAVYIEVEYEDVLPDWALIDANSEVARWSMSMVYDSDREVTVMFGGRSSAPPFGPLSDTWEFDGTSWTQVVTAHAPEPRFWHAMAYDSNRKRVVLYGGGDLDVPVLYEGTWEYDGADWLKIETSLSPPALSQMSMAFDSHLDQIVLFGGQYFWGESNQTWTYNGVDWTQVFTANSPPRGTLAAMAFDSVRNKTVFFGSGVVGDEVLSDAGTWEFDGVNWNSVATASSPMHRWGFSMVYDSTRQNMVLYGGYGPSYPSGTNLSDTWEYDGFNWTQVRPTHFPGDRTQYGMSYDATHKQVLLFGGIGDTGGNDTWAYIDELSSEEQVDNILRLIDYAVEDGSLEASGPGNSTGGRLGALINMIERAEELIANDFVPEACQQLHDVKLKTDGESPPPDFVSGPKAVELEQLIQDLLDSLNCGGEPDSVVLCSGLDTVGTFYLEDGREILVPSGQCLSVPMDVPSMDMWIYECIWNDESGQYDCGNDHYTINAGCTYEVVADPTPLCCPMTVNLLGCDGG
jgi:hypothetical protein